MKKFAIPIAFVLLCGILGAYWVSTSDRRFLEELQSGKRPADAVGRLEKMAAEDTDDLLPQVWLLKLMVEEGNTTEARNRAALLEVKGYDDYLTQKTLCNYYLERRIEGRAVGFCDMALKLNEARPAEDLNAYASAQIMRGKYKLALDALLEAEKKAPKDPNVINNLGYCYLSMKNYKPAEKQLKRAIELAPEFAKPRKNLARLYYEQAEFKKAVGELEQILAFEQNDPDVWVNLATIYRVYIDKDKGREYARIAVQKGFGDQIKLTYGEMVLNPPAPLPGGDTLSPPMRPPEHPPAMPF